MGAECPPETSDWEISPDQLWKRGKGNKGKWGKRRKIEKGKVENWKCKQEKLQNEERTFFFFFFSLFTFKNHWNLFWVNQNGNFLPGKKYQEKWLCPLRKIVLLRPCYQMDRVKQPSKQVVSTSDSSKLSISMEIQI